MLAVAGDGGFQYGIAELATAKQHELDAALLVIDDGGYGILREYQASSGFEHTAVDLEHPDLIALAAAYDIPARRSSAERPRARPRLGALDTWAGDRRARGDPGNAGAERFVELDSE